MFGKCSINFGEDMKKPTFLENILLSRNLKSTFGKYSFYQEILKLQILEKIKFEEKVLLMKNRNFKPIKILLQVLLLDKILRRHKISGAIIGNR